MCKHLFAGMLVAAVVSAVGATLSYADLSTKTATQGGLQIQYTPNCATTPPTTYNLGSFSVSVSNVDATYMDMSATFTVNTGAGAPPASLFNCAQFYWYQNVETLPPNDPATYKGQQVSPATGAKKLPITDPPSGGWDYMYLDGAARTMPDPAYNVFLDNQPFYYTAAGQAAHSVPGTSYTIEDEPAKRPDNGGFGVQFLTYLVAVVPQQCDCDDPDCLAPGQIMVLGGFAWHAGTADIAIESTFPAPLSGSVADVNAGLANGGFTPAWTAVSNADFVICCPEPTALGLLGLGGLGLLARRRRAA